MVHHLRQPLHDYCLHLQTAYIVYSDVYVHSLVDLVEMMVLPCSVSYFEHPATFLKAHCHAIFVRPLFLWLFFRLLPPSVYL